jgi:hypothetical protein
VAVFAAWLGLATMAPAQEGYPSPVGAARLPEPLNYTPNQPPTPLVPGPLNPLMAPAGPPPSLNLPAGHTSAFQLDHFPPESAGYASVGLMGLQRQSLTKVPIAYTDTQFIQVTPLPRNTTQVRPTPAAFIPNTAVGVDTGVTAIGLYPAVLRLDQANPEMDLGVRATVGYLFADTAFELSGFYMPGTTNKALVGGQGLLTVPFGPDTRIPLGFEGNNLLWRQADVVQVRYTNAVASAEANLRTWNIGLTDLDLIAGIRFLYNQERVDIFTDDEFYVRDVFNRSDPTRAATYTSGVRNNHLGFQLGFEYGAPVPVEWLMNSVWLNLQGKASIGANFIERSFRLVREDGYQGFNLHENTILLGSVSEVTAGIDCHIMERLRFRAGYTFLFALGFSTPGAQINYNLTTPTIRGTDSNSVYWHGPIGELQFLF